MKTFARFLVFFAASILVPGVARSSDNNQAANVQSPQVGESQPQPVQPPSPAPTNLPPPPSAEVPAPPSGEPEASEQQVASTGQWVYTDQYGWVWMPYGDAYSYVPPNGAVPDMYVYYPAVGWCWLVAPWLWGWGPMPFFGVYGPWHFGWYGHGYGRWHGFVGHYGNVGWGGRGYWHGGQWHGYDRVSSGHPASPHQGGSGVSSRSGSRAPAGHSFAASHGGSSGGGGHGGHGGHGR